MLLPLMLLLLELLLLLLLLLLVAVVVLLQLISSLSLAVVFAVVFTSPRIEGLIARDANRKEASWALAVSSLDSLEMLQTLGTLDFEDKDEIGLEAEEPDEFGKTYFFKNLCLVLS